MIAKTFTGAAVITAALAAGFLTACQKQENTTTGQGPAEKAGAQVDRAASKAAEGLNKAGEKVGQALQSAGEKMEGAAQEAQKSDEAQKKE